MNVMEPWARSTPGSTVEKVYALSLEILRICGILLQPFIPGKADMLLNAMKIPRTQRTLQHAWCLRGTVNYITPGVKLFSRGHQRT
jgi:methionyl-tRNA synthetase